MKVKYSAEVQDQTVRCFLRGTLDAFFLTPGLGWVFRGVKATVELAEAGDQFGSAFGSVWGVATGTTALGNDWIPHWQP